MRLPYTVDYDRIKYSGYDFFPESEWTRAWANGLPCFPKRLVNKISIDSKTYDGIKYSGCNFFPEREWKTARKELAWARTHP